MVADTVTESVRNEEKRATVRFLKSILHFILEGCESSSAQFTILITEVLACSCGRYLAANDITFKETETTKIGQKPLSSI